MNLSFLPPKSITFKSSIKGQENITVAHHVIEKRGSHRHSMITCCSIHDQRIERLWKDMHKNVTVLCYKLFYFMQHHGILDHLNEYHLWALHHVFIPRINRALGEFVNSWNNHPFRNSRPQVSTATIYCRFFNILNLLPWTSLTTWMMTTALTMTDPFLLEEEETGVSIPQPH